MKRQSVDASTYELVPSSIRSCLVYLFTLAVFTFMGCGKEEAKPQARPAEVFVVKIEPRDTPITFEYVAQTQSSQQVEIRARVNGFLDKRVYTEGSVVKAGQVLAHLDDTQPRAALALADAQLASARKAAAEDQARLQQAEVTLQRRTQLLKDGVVGKAELDDAQSEVDSLKARIAYTQQQIGVAESQVAMQKTNLADMVVRAPFSGIAKIGRASCRERV